MRLQNKTIAITGGNSGIGRAIAELFAKQGAAVAVLGRNADTLAKTQTALGECAAAVLFEAGQRGCFEFVEQDLVSEVRRTQLPPHLAESVRKLRKSQQPPGQTRTRSSDEDRERAAQLFSQGQTSLELGHYQQAAALLKGAADLHHESAEYQLYALWAQFTSGRETGQEFTPLLDELKAAALASLKQDRRCALAHYAYGHISMIAGDFARAEQSFHFAWRLNPSDREAERYYRVATLRNRNTAAKKAL